MCCGAPIQAGEIATYYPVGTIAGVSKAKLCHIGGVDGKSVRCTEELRKKYASDKGLNKYAGDGLDARYEDDCKDRCGL
jgi:hypothetical protein